MPASIVIIAAVARNGVIGKDNRLPWRLPEDMRHFKALTRGHTVIMGRKTWESLPDSFRPLPERHNIVVSRNRDYRAEGATVADSLATALAAAGDADEVFVIGGADLYAQALAVADRLQLTELDAAFAGDARFPPFDRSLWRRHAGERQVGANGLAYAFVTYERA